MLRGENAVAKTLQSAVETLERDKAQLQGRVCSLEQRLMGTQASEDAAGAPPSGEEAAVRRRQHLDRHHRPCCSPRPPAGGAVLEQLREEKEFAEGQVRARAVAQHARSGLGCQFSPVSCSSSPDQLPEQRHRGPAAEKRGAEDQTEEAGSGRVQRQRRGRRVRRLSLTQQLQ